MLNSVTEIEKKLQKAFGKVLAIDEVNVFSLLFGIVVCGVILPHKTTIKVNDSKKLTSSQISKIADQLRKSKLQYVIKEVPVKDCNLHYIKGEYRVIKQIAKELKPDFVLIDYHSLPTRFNIPQWGMLHADELTWGCAAASILAKDYFNRKVEQFFNKHPEYKGIGSGSLTRRSMLILQKHGMIPSIMRKKWIESAIRTMDLHFKLNLRNV
ncbi:MAG: hypothetical protein ACTSYR_02030 [Candidatus Odinarchaeia archaeon]